MTATEYRNGYGRSYWQPTIGDQFLAKNYDRSGSWKVWTGHPERSDPVVYRSKRRAERVARREERRRKRAEMREVEPVTRVATPDGQEKNQ